MIPSTMKALVTLGNGEFQLQDIATPTVKPHEILVKVNAVAQNPTDWKTLLLHNKAGNILGCDFAGTVVKMGSEVEVRKIDERVAGTVHGGVSPNGAFAEYVAVDAALVIVIPDTMTFENAAQLGASCFTVCQSLYQCLGLPPPLQPTAIPEDILIWSGTSATGYYGVQFAKLAGLRVISTASARNIELVKSLGADVVFEYSDSLTAKRISRATNNSLKYAVDCISEGMTPNQVSMSLGKEGGTIATVLPYHSKRRDAPVNTVFILAYSIHGRAIEFPFPFPAHEEHYRNAIEYCKMISDIIAQGLLKPMPLRLYPHGLSSVRQGLEDMKAGKVHAEKITYRIADTAGMKD